MGQLNKYGMHPVPVESMVKTGGAKVWEPVLVNFYSGEHHEGSKLAGQRTGGIWNWNWAKK